MHFSFPNLVFCLSLIDASFGFFSSPDFWSLFARLPELEQFWFSFLAEVWLIGEKRNTRLLKVGISKTILSE
jgi:hypothetical protein